jgi:5'-methylthioadenosine phosphorylase|tara:strand:- start:2252 stop:3148 length:897 start_codon:yes stop_codon:yes gene_type:complete
MMKKRKLGIIGGSGLYKMGGFTNTQWKKIKTSWGEPSDDILVGKLGIEEIYFLPRHARGHKINPSNINFRANIDALKQLGVTDIISVSAVGSLKENLNPGTFVIVDQFIDRTFSRVKTFFDEEIVAHVSMAKPTSPSLSKCCEIALKKLNINHQNGGTYIVMEGPQFSTLAESNLYRSWRADVIGMTNMPEAKLAREAEIRYSTVAMVTDFDCWHKDHDEVNVSMVVETLTKNALNAENMIKEVVKTFKDFPADKDPANNCLDTAIITDPKVRSKKTIKKLEHIAGRVLMRDILVKIK